MEKDKTMKIQCPQCSAVYNIDESKIPEKGGRLQCKKCPEKIFVPGIPKKKQRKTAPVLPPDHEMLSEETIMEQYVRGRDEDSAVKALYEAILEYSGKKKFLRAEMLREKLIEIAPMALTEIVDSEKVIADRKSAAVDKDRIKPWAELFEKFTKNEMADFYFALNDLNVPAGRPVFEQGSMTTVCILYGPEGSNLRTTTMSNRKTKKWHF
jgi:predicted Zn finger-like uncharacterized protein